MALGSVLFRCRWALEGVGLETVLWGGLAVGGSVVLAVTGFFVAWRLVPLDLKEAHNSNIAVMFGALYVMYGLVVGFSAYFVSNQYDAAQRTVQAEATSVEEIHLLAEGFPGAERGRVQDLTESYARFVVDKGWALMREERIGTRAGEISDELRREIIAFEPDTGRENALHSQALTLVAELDEQRALRLLEVTEGIPSILWVVLVLGGCVTVGFTYLLGIRTGWLHVSMIAAYTFVLALILFTIHALDYPFDGLVQVGPEAFPP